MPGYVYRHRGDGPTRSRASIYRNAYRLYGPLVRKAVSQVGLGTAALGYTFKGKKKKKRVKKGRANTTRLRGVRKPKRVVSLYGKRVSTPVVTEPSVKSREYPQTLRQKYWVTSPESYIPLSTTDGTITNPDMLYSPSSLSWANASIMMFNISNTERHWVPLTNLPVDGYRTGTQLQGVVGGSPGILGTENTSFIWENNATSTNLQSRRSPMEQSGLAENAVGANARYTTPNSLLTGVSWKLKVSNPTIQAQMLSVKLIRYNNGADGTLLPGTFGSDATEAGALINTMCNARAWTDSHEFSTLYTKTYRLPGIRPGTRMFMQDISGSHSCRFLRTQFRKIYNANSMATLGTQAKPTYMRSEDGEFFNSCFLIVSSTCVDDQYVADVSVEKDTGTNPEYLERMPQLATYPPVGIPATVGSGNYKPIATGAQFGIAGSVSVTHRVQAIRRAIGSATASALTELQDQLDALTLISKVKGKKPDSDSE